MATIKKRTWRAKDGSQREAWQLSYQSDSGVQIRKQFRSKAEADRERRRVEREIDTGTHVPDNATVTVAEAGKKWIETGEDEKLEPTTLDQRRQHLRYHIEPLIGSMKLSKLTVPVVTEFQSRLRREPYPDDFPAERKRGMVRSAQMVSRVMVSLGSLLADAQMRGLVGRNVIREMPRKPKGERAKRHTSKKLRVGTDIPTFEEIARIVGAAEGRYRPLIITAIFTGLRSSELRGLRWSDVDLEKRTLTVRQRADNKNDFGSPKTEDSWRTLPLPQNVVNTFREWKLACPKGSDNLVFPNGEGNVEWHANIIKRGWHPVQIAAGVVVDSGKRDKDGKPILAAKYPGLHALRHFFASWCIHPRDSGGLGLTLKDVQVRMGHASIVMTGDVYGHLFPREDEHTELDAASDFLLHSVSG